MNILTKFLEGCVINVASTVVTRFSRIRPNDLVFGCMWPRIKLSLDIVKLNILKRFDRH